jgi:uncharacterized protein (DUF983 family)
MVGFLIVGTIKLMIWMLRLSIWLVVAMVVIPGGLIASLTGHEQAARQWWRALPRVPLP